MKKLTLFASAIDLTQWKLYVSFDNKACSASGKPASERYKTFRVLSMFAPGRCLTQEVVVREQNAASVAKQFKISARFY